MVERLVVVAGASSESGRAVAGALASAGHRVIAIGSNLDRLQGVEATARYECDLGDAPAVTALSARVAAEHGRIDGLVHLVGGWRAGQSDEDFRWLEERVLTTLRNTTRAFREDLSTSVAGRLATVSSTSVDSPTWSNANYAAVKAAAEAWVKAVASGWKKPGTAAAVMFVVSSLGEGGTPVDLLAAQVVALWDKPAAALNGTHVSLVP